MPGLFEGLHICSPPSREGRGERAGWQTWRCPECGHPWDLEHYYDEDGQ